MKYCINVLAVFILAQFWVIGESALAADNVLTFVPADAEVVLCVNVRQAVDSDLCQTILLEEWTRQAQDDMAMFQEFTGVDLLRDIDRACFWSHVGDKDSEVVLFQGRFDRQTITGLLSQSPEYGVSEYQGKRIHEWYDDKEDRTKYGAFFGDGSVLLGNQVSSMEAAIMAKTGKGRLLSSPKANLLPVNRGKVVAWGALFKIGDAVSSGPLSELMQAKAVGGTLTLEKTGISAHLKVIANSPDAARKWQDLARGFIAFSGLQEKNPGLKTLASSTKVALGPDSAVNLETRVTNQQFMNLVEKK
jgi:hypothetical protein